ncbi:hypothetical protein C5B42_00955 [Candidatus Cerribacteria bacterium 'Amazon FNV 2010 28 9']|uniref:Uncharacterized protein n=1 Tax=Candidatus Cerribacteria bacterium 'Amazon FNV 2010 28 9' TaxID=2081795 RepID=A0A317JQ22_9BACT|nr:MAG: hypothetical protein C5B42_00955 [Candidatus Cerribacteria bacterium 'Amazon FNV 2010 28 9']
MRPKEYLQDYSLRSVASGTGTARDKVDTQVIQNRQQGLNDRFGKPAASEPTYVANTDWQDKPEDAPKLSLLQQLRHIFHRG